MTLSLAAASPVTGHAPAGAIVVERLVKRYGAVEAVRGISFSVRARATTALLGGNGAGKTTTLLDAAGVLEPTAGEVRVLGVDMRRDRLRRCRA
jgi:ABC-2 type transport system ATP-binding protein